MLSDKEFHALLKKVVTHREKIKKKQASLREYKDKVSKDIIDPIRAQVTKELRTRHMTKRQVKDLVAQFYAKTTQSFDVNAFKKSHPDLYKMYVRKNRSYGTLKIVKVKPKVKKNE